MAHAVWIAVESDGRESCGARRQARAAREACRWSRESRRVARARSPDRAARGRAAHAVRLAGRAMAVVVRIGRRLVAECVAHAVRMIAVERRPSWWRARGPRIYRGGASRRRNSRARDGVSQAVQSGSRGLRQRGHARKARARRVTSRRRNRRRPPPCRAGAGGGGRARDRDPRSRGTASRAEIVEHLLAARRRRRRRRGRRRAERADRRERHGERVDGHLAHRRRNAVVVLSFLDGGH